eukprot:SAG22_NODE_1010_length_6043_cov_2.870962_3_plen_917_part_00
MTILQLYGLYAGTSQYGNLKGRAPAMADVAQLASSITGTLSFFTQAVRNDSALVLQAAADGVQELRKQVSPAKDPSSDVELGSPDRLRARSSVYLRGAAGLPSFPSPAPAPPSLPPCARGAMLLRAPPPFLSSAGGWAAWSQTDAQLGIRRYRVVSDALVTSKLEPPAGQSPEVVTMCHRGELLAALDSATTAAGQTRVRTAEGWISVVSNNGTVLLELAGDNGDRSSDTAATAAAAAAEGERGDGAGAGAGAAGAASAPRAFAPGQPQRDWPQWAEASLRERAWAEAIWGVVCVPAGLAHDGGGGGDGAAAGAGAAAYRALCRRLAAGRTALVAPPVGPAPAPVVLAAEAVPGRRYTVAGLPTSVAVVRLNQEELLVAGRTLVRCPAASAATVLEAEELMQDPEAVQTAWLPLRKKDGDGLGFAVRDGADGGLPVVSSLPRGPDGMEPGPAETAGLLVGCRLVTLGGGSVTTSQSVQAAIDVAEARDGRRAGVSLQYKLPRGWIPLQTAAEEVARYLAAVDCSCPPDQLVEENDADREETLVGEMQRLHLLAEIGPDDATWRQEMEAKLSLPTERAALGHCLNMRRGSPKVGVEPFVRLGFLLHMALDYAAAAEDFPCCLELLHMANTYSLAPEEPEGANRAAAAVDTGSSKAAAPPPPVASQQPQKQPQQPQPEQQPAHKLVEALIGHPLWQDRRFWASAYFIVLQQQATSLASVTAGQTRAKLSPAKQQEARELERSIGLGALAAVCEQMVSVDCERQVAEALAAKIEGIAPEEDGPAVAALLDRLWPADSVGWGDVAGGTQGGAGAEAQPEPEPEPEPGDGSLTAATTPTTGAVATAVEAAGPDAVRTAAWAAAERAWPEVEAMQDTALSSLLKPRPDGKPRPLNALDRTALSQLLRDAAVAGAAAALRGQA